MEVSGQLHALAILTTLDVKPGGPKRQSGHCEEEEN
jgi:hypothetical protein